MDTTMTRLAGLGLGWRLMNAALAVLGLVVLLALESWAAWYAVASAPAGDPWATPWGVVPRAALLHGIVGAGCGLLAYGLMYTAGSLARDERPHIRASAGFARAVALMMLLVPIGNLAGAISYDHALAERTKYEASPAYAADQALALDPDADSHSRSEAAERLKPPSAAEFDPLAYLQAVFFHLLVALAASVKMAPPITQAEREAMAQAAAAAEVAAKRKAAALKAAATRKANAKAAKRKPILSLVRKA